MKIEYTISEVLPNIFAVVVPDSYHRALLFCRVEEFYESPNTDFRNKPFDIWDYIEWYSREHDDSFTYANDWGGFNIPLKKITECMTGLEHGIQSPYDSEMLSILLKLFKTIEENEHGDKEKAYVIGTDSLTSGTFKHELCHGLYYSNEEYKTICDEITKTIDEEQYNSLMSDLLDMGYTEQVVDDEIQAYMIDGWEKLNINKEINDYREKLSEKYISKLSKFFSENLVV